MRNISTRFLVAGSLFCFLGGIQPANAFLGVGDVVTDPGLTGETIAAEAARAGQTLTMIQNQMNQIQTAIQNTLALGDPVFAPLGNTLRSLQSMYMQGQGLMYRAQNLDSQFGYMYPSYESYLGTMGRGGSSMTNLYQKWSDQGNDNTRSALQAAGIQTNSMDDEQAMLQKLVLQSNTAGGQMQALQAANQIAAHQAQQIQELRMLIAQQTTLHANYMAQQNARQSAYDASDAFYRSTKSTNTPDGGF